MTWDLKCAPSVSGPDAGYLPTDTFCCKGSMDHWIPSACTLNSGQSSPCLSRSDCFCAFQSPYPCMVCLWLFLSSTLPVNSRSEACLLMFLSDFLGVWPVQLHFLLMISVATGYLFALLQVHVGFLLWPVDADYSTRTVVEERLEFMNCPWYRLPFITKTLTK